MAAHLTLADSALLSCTQPQRATVARKAAITFIRPGKLGRQLVATAREISRSGRSGIYDVSVTVDGVVIAEFRGHSALSAAHGCRRPNQAKITIRETRYGFDEPQIQGKRLPAPIDERARFGETRSWRCRPSGSPALAHGLRQCRALQKSFDKAGVHPSDFRQLSDLQKFPFTVKTDLRDNYLSTCSRSPAKNWCGARVLRHDGKTDRGRIHKSRYRRMVGGDGALNRAAGGRTGMIMQQRYAMAVHRRPRRALRRGKNSAARCAQCPAHDRAAGAVDHDSGRHHHGDAEYMLAILDEFKSRS